MASEHVENFFNIYSKITSKQVSDQRLKHKKTLRENILEKFVKMTKTKKKRAENINLEKALIFFFLIPGIFLFFLKYFKIEERI